MEWNDSKYQCNKSSPTVKLYTNCEMITKTVFVITATLAYASGFLVLPQANSRNLLCYNHFAKDSKDMKATAITLADEKVRVDLYYEALCPGCRQEYSELPDVYKSIGDHIDLNTYPYGNARTEGNKVTCQHGEAECYGNKLHACAIDILKDISKWLMYNACMMEKLSTDEAADQCGSEQKIDSAPIKRCAKGERGQELLIEYGNKTPEHPYVPYVLINGSQTDDDDLKAAICKAFKNPPPNCKN